MHCDTQSNLVLAEFATLGHISLCSCGTLHVAVGSVTIRMAPEVFHEMIRMCHAAADQLMLQAAVPHAASRLAN